MKRNKQKIAGLNLVDFTGFEMDLHNVRLGFFADFIFFKFTFV